jgi:large subunit ribosomal protein L17
MRHRKKNLHFGPEHRQRDDLRNLAAQVLLYERVVTTKDRAKRVKSIVDKMINVGKKKDLNSIRYLNKFFWDSNVSKKITEDLADQLKDRHSGYTRTIKIGHRVGDGSVKVLIELLVPHKEKVKKAKKVKKVKKVEKIEVEKAQPKSWFDRARDFGKRIGRRGSKVTTRTTSK